MITNKTLKRTVNYDPKTGCFTRLIQTTSSAKAGERADRKHSKGYTVIVINGETYLSHRLAWKYMTGKFPRNHMDHKNGIRHDNKWSNLRVVTQTINNQNHRKSRSDNKLGILGVCFRYGAYRAQICVKKKVIHLGYFPTSQKASAAYVSAKRKLHPGCTI